MCGLLRRAVTSAITADGALEGWSTALFPPTLKPHGALWMTHGADPLFFSKKKLNTDTASKTTGQFRSVIGIVLNHCRIIGSEKIIIRTNTIDNEHLF